MLTRQMRKCLSGGGSRVSKGVGGEGKVRKGIWHKLFMYLARLSVQYWGEVGGGDRLRRFEGWAVELRLDPVSMRSP